MTSSGKRPTTLFLDIGGVVLTNGWDRHARHRAAEAFGLDEEEMGERHHLTFDTYEEGKLTLDEYLLRTIFYQARSFSSREFKEFMFSQSRALPEMRNLLERLKERHQLKVVAVSNEGRELTAHRIETFDLRSLVDVFIASCFVHFRKPDPDIYSIALDVSQSTPEEVLYIDDREMFVQVARGLGLRGLHHVDYETSRAGLAELGLAAS